MKLELGAGQRPTLGYFHNDTHPFDHIENVGAAWMIDLPPDSLSEVLALAFVEHLTYDHARDTFRNVARMLEPEGIFLFDVPDYPTWAEYYLYNLSLGTNYMRDPDDVPSMDHIRKTLFGWQRFPGDEHLYGWDKAHLTDTLTSCGLIPIAWDVEPFKARAHRDRFEKPWDAHLYVTATK